MATAAACRPHHPAGQLRRVARAQQSRSRRSARISAFYSYLSAKLTVGDETERLVDVMVTCRFYNTLGVQPAIGRLFAQEECVDNGPKAVLMSHRLWERRFNSDRSLVGRTITLNNEPVNVIGVMPASFDFGSVFAPGTRADLWTPFAIDKEHDDWGNTLSVVGTPQTRRHGRSRRRSS